MTLVIKYDPYKELAYRVLEVAIRDAKGEQILGLRDAESNRETRKSIIAEARVWIKSPTCELFCAGLGIDHEMLMQRMNGGMK